MTKDKELLLHLERIADALEDALPLLEKIASPPVLLPAPPPPPPSPTPIPSGGYRCGICGNWVPSGNIHYCSGKTWPYTSPNICRTGSDQSSATGLPPNVTVWNTHGESIWRSDLHGHSTC